jgi:hypothetical protein
MNKIQQNEGIDNLPVRELEEALREFMEPVAAQLPDERLKEVAKLAVQGVIGGQSPLISQMARGVRQEEETIRPMARRMYRFVWNKRFSHRALLKGLYGIAQRAVAEHEPAHLIVALDPVNFEKPYTKALEGVCTVMKSTPPGPNKQKRLTSGYPAITAAIVNLPEPVVTYANWFSYVTADFVSENREIYRAIRITRALFPENQLCFVADSGFDDQKIFRQFDLVKADFVIRGCHERRVEVYNDRLDRWEEELLSDLIATVPLPLKTRVAFTHARRRRIVDKEIGWLKIRLLETQQLLWILVIHDPNLDHDIFLITNIPLCSIQDAKRVFSQWRQRPQIEHTYRFDQEAGLDIENVRVKTLERMRRIFVLVLLATLFIYHIDHSWPQPAVLWLRNLGGKFGLLSDADGSYVLLAGIQAVFVTASTIAFALRHPFPRWRPTCG